MNKIVKNLLMGLLIFVLVVAGGLLGWYYSKSWRGQKSALYLEKSEQYIEQKSSNALWELEKAYLMGMNYGDYQIKKALALLKLNDERAIAQAKLTIDRGWVSDDLYFWYGKRLFEIGDYVNAEKQFLKISDDLDESNIDEYYEYMAFLAGSHGNFSQAVEFLDKSLVSENELANNMKIFLDAVNDNWTEIDKLELADEMKKNLDELEKMNGDLYVLKLADVANDMGLSSWCRALIDGQQWKGVNNKYIYLVYARSYLVENDCGNAWEYLKNVEEDDSIDEDLHILLAQTYKCLGNVEWMEWEEGKQ